MVTEVQETEHLEIQKAEGKEVLETTEKMEFTAKQNVAEKEQEEEEYQKEKEKVLRAEEEKLQEYEARLVEKERNLVQREKFVQEMEYELMEKDVQRKLEKELWLKEEEDRKKREEEQQRPKNEEEQKKINEEERKNEEEQRKNEEMLRMRKKEESTRAKEQFQVRMWEKRENKELDQKILDVEYRMLEIENWKKHVEQREQYLQISIEQELERQRAIEAFMNGKDEEIKKRQFHMHQKGKELKDGECRLLKLDEETRLREREHQEERKQCEIKWKLKEFMLMEGEREMRERKNNVELREKEVLERGTKAQNAGKLAEKNEEELLATNDGLLLQEQKQDNVDLLLSTDPKPHSDDRLQQRQLYSVALQQQPKPHCEGRLHQQKQQDVHQLPPKREPHHSSHSEFLKDERAEIEKRKNNVVFRGVKEGKGEHDKEAVAKLIKAMNLEIEPVRTLRIGRYVENSFRPMKVVFKCESDRNQVLTNNKKIRNLNDLSLWPRNIYIIPDYTQLQREKEAMLLSDLDKKRESDPNGRYTIKGDKVVLLKKPKGKFQLRR